MKKKYTILSLVLVASLCACSKNSKISPKEAYDVASNILTAQENAYDYFLDTYNLEYWSETVSAKDNYKEKEIIDINYSLHKKYFSIHENMKRYFLNQDNGGTAYSEIDTTIWFYLLNESDVYYVVEENRLPSASTSYSEEKDSAASSEDKNSPYKVTIKTLPSREEAVEFFNTKYITGIQNYLNLFLNAGTLKFIQEKILLTSDEDEFEDENTSITQRYESQLPDHLVYDLKYSESSDASDSVKRIYTKKVSGTFISNITRYYNETQSIVAKSETETEEILSIKKHTNIDPYSVKVKIPVK